MNAAGERAGPDGLLEWPVLVDSDEPVVIGIGHHPDWKRLDRIHRLRLDIGPPGTRALLRRIELLP